MLTRCQTVVITGGSQGMGRGLGKLLAQKGANVVIVARNAKKLEEALEYISVQLPIARRCAYCMLSADNVRPPKSNLPSVSTISAPM